MARKKAAEDDLVDETPTPGIGHNSTTGSKEELEKIIDNLEQINTEKKIAADNFSAAMSYAKSKGFDPVQIREALKLRAMDKEKREEFLHNRDLYLATLGIV